MVAKRTSDDVGDHALLPAPNMNASLASRFVRQGTSRACMLALNPRMMVLIPGQMPDADLQSCSHQDDREPVKLQHTLWR